MSGYDQQADIDDLHRTTAFQYADENFEIPLLPEIRLVDSEEVLLDVGRDWLDVLLKLAILITLAAIAIGIWTDRRHDVTIELVPTGTVTAPRSEPPAVEA